MSRERGRWVIIFVTAFLCYAYFYQGGGWNQNVRFDLTRSLVEHHSLQIDEYLCSGDHPPGVRQHRNTGDEAKRGSHFYCDKAPGVSFLSVPAYSLAATFHGSGPRSKRFLADSSYFATLLSVALPSALSVVALFALLGILGLGLGPRLVLTAGYALGTLALPYSTLLYGHQLAAALLLCAFALLVRAKHDPKAKHHSFLVGLLLGFSVLVEYPAGLAVLPIFIYASSALGIGKELLRVSAGMAICALLLLAYHWSAFGGPFTLPYEFSTQEHRGLGYFLGLGTPNWDAFSNTIYTSYRGLFFSAPWLLLAFPGAYLLIRRETFAEEAVVCLSIVGLFVWMTSSLVDSWHGGSTLGARYMIPAIPFLVVPAAGVLGAQLRRHKFFPALVGLVGLAIAYSVLLMLAGTAVRPEVPETIAKPFGGYLLKHFYAGELALNMQSIDAYEVGSEVEAWNLGQRLGLEGLWSLLPLLLILVGAALLCLRGNTGSAPSASAS